SGAAVLPLDANAPVGQVAPGVGHIGNRRQGAFDAAHAARAGDAVDREIDMSKPTVEMADEVREVGGAGHGCYFSTTRLFDRKTRSVPRSAVSTRSHWPDATPSA